MRTIGSARNRDDQILWLLGLPWKGAKFTVLILGWYQVYKFFF